MISYCHRATCRRVAATSAAVLAAGFLTLGCTTPPVPPVARPVGREQPATHKVARAASGVAPPLILLVGPEPGDPYVERAFTAQALANGQRMSAEQYEKEKPTDAAIVIFDGYTPTYLPAAGVFVWFGCVPPGGRVCVDGHGPADGKMVDVAVRDWQRDDPIVGSLNLSRLHAATMYKLSVPSDAHVLVSGTKGPMIVLDRDGPLTNLVVAFSPLESNWPLLQANFPLFIHSALQGLTPAIGAATTQP